MLSAVRAAPLTRFGPRPQPIALSVLAHAAIFSLVILGPRPAALHKPRSAYDELIRPHEHQLVWYSFRQKLPEVSPQPSADSKPPGAEIKNPFETIIANPKHADPGTQMIWRPAPRIAPQPPVAAPNILAFRVPLIQPPAPAPPPKPFTPPGAAPQIPAAAAPALAAPPVLPARAVPKPETPLLAENMTAALANRPEARRFVAPAVPERTAALPVALPEAPKLAVRPASPSGAVDGLSARETAAALANKPEPRKFLAPAGKAGGNASNPGAVSPTLEEAPSLEAGAMPSANVNVAIVGLNPAARLNGPLPEGSRDAKFSTGPELSTGSEGASGSNSALSVPGLLVRGGAAPASMPGNPLLIARAAPTSRETLEAAMKSAGSVSTDRPSPEVHLALAPDPAFNGRDVYSLAIQMPNISSYVGSWIMWFAERDPMPNGGHGLRPPVPVHKVDPKYLPAAISERIEGKVQIAGVIRVNGRVDLVRVLKGVDPRLDRSAQEALLKWEFAPAERNGRPVEVDLVAEIPFQLAPQAKR